MGVGVKSLLVFGASSPTGQHIVEEALNNGWEVTIYGRRTLQKHSENSQITTLEGTLQDESNIRHAIRNATVIVSVIGPSGTTIKNTPFPGFYRRMFDIMREEGVRRIIALSTFSVPHPNDRFNFTCHMLVSMLRLFGHSAWRNLIDVAATFDQHGSDLDWTLFRVGFLKDGGPGQVIQGYVGDGKLGMGVNRVDVAKWVVQQASMKDAENLGDKPGISSA
ncbi:NAD(P)-binding protein [Penicillium cataractarum]|uniref:NAD(P)-binding protein n=1 Tax=Penicillium cataractarum TaxID=2100454 RepID=A0A9W9V0V7_9EURO|nr:NAD(P)-binding protein [Penicillium cataractarum]KAJ5363609.1 NAD(P)-binding protein [Penicillium cataractarum]